MTEEERIAQLGKPRLGDIVAINVHIRESIEFKVRLRLIPPWYVTRPTGSTQPRIPLGSLNRVLALIGLGKGGNVTSAGWEVTLCDPIWHVSSRSGAVLVAQTAIRFFTCLPFVFTIIRRRRFVRTREATH